MLGADGAIAVVLVEVVVVVVSVAKVVLVMAIGLRRAVGVLGVLKAFKRRYNFSARGCVVRMLALRVRYAPGVYVYKYIYI